MFSNKKIIFLNEVESTNNYANRLVLTNSAEEGTVVLAQFQSKGRGHQGNHWESEPGKNLLASYILFPRFLPVEKQFYLSKIASLALADFLECETGGTSIKWPNDIYFENRKIGGILIENGIKANVLDNTIIGIGLNLNQVKFNSDAPNPVSLKQITGRTYAIADVAEDLALKLEEWYLKLKMGNYEAVDKAYCNRLFRLNLWSHFAKEGKTFEAKITGIGNFGKLKLELRDGSVSEFQFKEVEFVM